jgi:hypothetical protein
MGKEKVIEPNDYVKVKDDIGKEIEAEQERSLEREIKDFKKALEDKKKGKERFLHQVARFEELNAIIGAKMSKITPTYEFEKDPRYWELQLEEHNDKVEQQRQVYEGARKKFDLEIEHMEDTIKSSEEKLQKLKEQGE